MSDEKRRIIIAKFLKNLSRRLFKSVPNRLRGLLFERLIYDTLEAEAAQEEAGKLRSALSRISEEREGQDVGFGDILSALAEESDFREEVRAEMHQIVALLKDPDNVDISDRLAKAVETMLIHNLPYPSIGDLFKGRDEVLGSLRSELGAGKAGVIVQVQAINGLGGVGKTRLAVEYAWRAFEEARYWAAFFVTANTVTSLNRNIAALAGPRLLNLPERDKAEQAIIVEAVLQGLGHLRDWLLIIDGVDSKEVSEHLHKHVLGRLAGGDVLITSRMSDWPDEVADLPIDKLVEVDAAAYLLEKTEGKRRLSSEDEALAGELAHGLDGLPLALEQAASYINCRRIGFAAYQEELAEARAKVFSGQQTELVNYPLPVVAACRVTEECLQPWERGILRIACLLAPEPIPAALFASQPKKITEAGKLLLKEVGLNSKLANMRGGLDVHSLLVALSEWSMINLTDDRFTVHPLVQDLIRGNIPEGKDKAWAKLALRLANDYVPQTPAPDDVRSWALWSDVDSHVASLLARGDALNVAEPTSALMHRLGRYLKARARFDEAEPIYRRALELRQKSSGHDHPDVATALNDLANLLRQTNRPSQAEPLYYRTLQIYEKSFGPDHPWVATALNNLAGVLRATQRPQEAERMYRRALEIDEKSWGAEHPTVAADLNKLAGVVRAANRVQEARALYSRALGILERSLGPDHRKTQVVRKSLEALK